MRDNKIFKLADRYIGIILLIILYPVNQILKLRKRVVPGNILVIKLSAMGDTILLIPALKFLREQFPDSQIDFLCTTINNKIIENCPYINNIILLDINRLIINPVKTLQFIINLFNKKYDTVIDADQWLRISALLSFFTFARQRAGFYTRNQYKHYLFTDIIEHDREKHEVECFLDLVVPVIDDSLETIKTRTLKGATTSFPIDKGGKIKLEYWVSENDLIQAKQILEKTGINRKFIIIHPSVPGHGWQRQFPIEKVIQLCNELLKLSDNYQIVLTGTKNDEQLVNGILKSVNNTNLYRITGIPLNVLAGILKLSSLLVCNNTGILHLASALHVPVVAIHGPTDPKKWGPYDTKSVVIKPKLNCSPCLYLGFEYGCDTNKCIAQIEVNEILSAIKSLL